MPINPQLLALLAQKAGTGDVDPLAQLLDQQVPGGPPTSIQAPSRPFPLPPRGGSIPHGAGTGGSGVSRDAGRPTSLPALAQAAPQALGAAAPQSPLGGGILASLGGLLGGASPTPGSSAGPALAGGLPNAPTPGGGVNPLEALVPPTAGQQQPAPRAIAPSPGGGQINPQIMQLILQALSAGGQPQQPAQSLGAILGQLR